jgi:hypothetical protein
MGRSTWPRCPAQLGLSLQRSFSASRRLGAAQVAKRSGLDPMRRAALRPSAGSRPRALGQSGSGRSEPFSTKAAPQRSGLFRSRTRAQTLITGQSVREPYPSPICGNQRQKHCLSGNFTAQPTFSIVRAARKLCNEKSLYLPYIPCLGRSYATQYAEHSIQSKRSFEHSWKRSVTSDAITRDSADLSSPSPSQTVSAI